MKNLPRIFKAKLDSLIDFEKNGFTALNTAFIGEGVFIHLPKNVKIEVPIQLLFFTDDGKVSFPRVLIVAEEFAEATIIESYLRTDETKYLTNAVIEISLADEAKVKHYTSSARIARGVSHRHDRHINRARFGL